MHKQQLKHPQLCLVTDPERPNLIQKVERALAAGVTMLQLRGHMLSSAHLYTLASVLRPLCQQYQATFIVNDRVDIGLAVDADGLQLGGHSLPLTVARQLVGEHRLLGASVHSQKAACAAVAAGADFLLVGTIFASPSHPGGPTSGPQLVRTLRSLGLSLPLLAIGGINSSNAQQLIQAGSDGVAVISAILDAPHIEQAVRELRSNIA
ncbi:MAG: thiamine phosphate synthase [Ktedonobacteraceae bacterium]